MIEKYLNKIVKVKIDRPLNSLHPHFKNLKYEVNYGFIPNTLAVDNEEIDAYILRVNKPLKTFVGKVVGIIKRTNDVEDKLVVMPKDNSNNVTIEEIRLATNFQEKYFNSTILIDNN